jgi:hypothetical protein
LLDFEGKEVSEDLLVVLYALGRYYVVQRKRERAQSQYEIYEKFKIVLSLEGVLERRLNEGYVETWNVLVVSFGRELEGRVEAEEDLVFEGLWKVLQGTLGI